MKDNIRFIFIMLGIFSLVLLQYLNYASDMYFSENNNISNHIIYETDTIRIYGFDLRQAYCYVGMTRNSDIAISCIKNSFDN